MILYSRRRRSGSHSLSSGATTRRATARRARRAAGSGAISRAGNTPRWRRMCTLLLLRARRRPRPRGPSPPPPHSETPRDCEWRVDADVIITYLCGTSMISMISSSPAYICQASKIHMDHTMMAPRQERDNRAAPRFIPAARPSSRGSTYTRKTNRFSYIFGRPVYARRARDNFRLGETHETHGAPRTSPHHRGGAPWRPMSAWAAG